MSKKCKAYSASKIGLEPADNRKAFYAGWDSAIREALPKPEQEPVAWRDAALRVGEDLCSVGPFGYYDMTAKQWLDWALSVVTVHAPPPQRTWIGLTDEEMSALKQKSVDDGMTRLVSDFEYIRAIEAKLREKNGG